MAASAGNSTVKLKRTIGGPCNVICYCCRRRLVVQMLELLVSYLRKQGSLVPSVWVPAIKHMFIIQATLLRSVQGGSPQPPYAVDVAPRHQTHVRHPGRCTLGWS